MTLATSIHHSGLPGLLLDTHTQYLLVDGSRDLAGNWDLGGFDLTNSGSINGATFFGDVDFNLAFGDNGTLGSLQEGAINNVAFGVRAGEDITLGDNNVLFGRLAGRNITTGKSNVCVGDSAGSGITTGTGNFIMGSGSGSSLISAGSNVVIGTNTLVAAGIGANQNVAIGTTAMRGLNAVVNNPLNTVAIGHGSLAHIDSGNSNVSIGYLSGNELTTGSSNIFLGQLSGRNQTTNSNLLIIDNLDRGSQAAELTDCLICGVMDATPVNQTLNFNASVTILADLTVDTNTLHVDSATGNVGIGLIDPAKKFEIGSTDGTDRISIYHDNANAHFRTDDGEFRFVTDEGTNTDSVLNILGKGTGNAVLTMNNETVLRRASTVMESIPGASIPWRLFNNSTNGETQRFRIAGFKDGDEKRTADLRISSIEDDTFRITGVSNYRFDGHVKTAALTVGDGSSNELLISSVGNLSLVGDARVKVELGIPISGTGGGANKPTFIETFAPFDGWGMGINDDLHYVFEVPSDVDISEDIEFHIHWFINEAFADNSGEINWQIIYRAIKEDGTEPVDSGGSSATVTTGDINIPTISKALLETQELVIIAANIDQDDVIGIDLSRIAIIDGSNPTANPIITAVELHYTKNKLGIVL